MKNALIANSKVNFTHECSVENKIPFLDVLLEINGAKYDRHVYRKPTSAEECIKYNCDAPDRYKTGVIYTLLHRAKKICSTKESFETEKKRIKNLLVNNGFPNAVLDRISKRFKFALEMNSAAGSNAPAGSNLSLDETRDQSSLPNSANVNGAPVESRCVKVFYENQFHNHYKLDEDAIRKIIKNHILQISVEVKLVVYYKSPKSSNLIMKNNLSRTSISHGCKSHLVYEFTCQEGQCSALNTKYIGMTTCMLRDRMKKHKYQGSIFSHFHTVHRKNPEIESLLESTKILYFSDNPILLPIIEALLIRKYDPNLNGKNEYLGLNIN